MRPRDIRGRDVHVGDRVAYNYSGDVALGTVVNITRGGVTHVLQDDECRRQRLVPAGQVPEPVVSKVKRGRSVLVLIPSDTERR